jgi:hypothetical protein
MLLGSPGLRVISRTSSLSLLLERETVMEERFRSCGVKCLSKIVKLSPALMRAGVISSLLAPATLLALATLAANPSSLLLWDEPWSTPSSIKHGTLCLQTLRAMPTDNRQLQFFSNGLFFLSNYNNAERVVAWRTDTSSKTPVALAWHSLLCVRAAVTSRWRDDRMPSSRLRMIPLAPNVKTH